MALFFKIVCNLLEIVASVFKIGNIVNDFTENIIDTDSLTQFLSS